VAPLKRCFSYFAFFSSSLVWVFVGCFGRFGYVVGCLAVDGYGAG
jgi:hypothetical protein